MGNYSNGQSKALAQVALTTFPNPNGMLNMGNNLWQGTSTSGEGVMEYRVKVFAVFSSQLQLKNRTST